MNKLVLIVMMVLVGNTAFAVQDTAENRTREADRYLSVSSPREMFQDVAEQLALNLPPEQREQFKDILTRHLDIEAVTKSMKDSMVKVFTADELAALADFYGSPVGISAMKKMGVYMGELMPVIQAEALKAIAKANREMKDPEEGAAEPAK
ncbi:DUF2059 domain-containing protein [Geomobilimonas luticola]|uniref:DUF2059 domain-containing protein n=1 Tax=Geomobilimonas luticola TaxID=1114878 RepID=A0ABS5SG29_9BACT|nr:DUF2059 domain-containing protein [Geomobilimonas luticola]MBT0654319.1 DUF2059 domain-containing protein [Geomobilimonas luticola]